MLPGLLIALTNFLTIIFSFTAGSRKWEESNFVAQFVLCFIMIAAMFGLYLLSKKDVKKSFLISMVVFYFVTLFTSLIGISNLQSTEKTMNQLLIIVSLFAVFLLVCFIIKGNKKIYSLVYFATAGVILILLIVLIAKGDGQGNYEKYMKKGVPILEMLILAASGVCAFLGFFKEPETAAEANASVETLEKSDIFNKDSLAQFDAKKKNQAYGAPLILFAASLVATFIFNIFKASPSNSVTPVILLIIAEICLLKYSTSFEKLFFLSLLPIAIYGLSSTSDETIIKFLFELCGLGIIIAIVALLLVKNPTLLKAVAFLLAAFFAVMLVADVFEFIIKVLPKLFKGNYKALEAIEKIVLKLFTIAIYFFSAILVWLKYKAVFGKKSAEA